MFRIIKEDEALTVNNVNVLIYGDPSAGKTSLANTSKNPITLDFDKGAHRSAFRKDVLVIENWKAIAENQKAFIDAVKNYDTIIIDTADSMLEFMGAYAITKNNKLATNKLQWYGAIKDMFSQFVATLKAMQKDIIFIAHCKEKDEGDNRVKRPAIMGGSYDKVLQTCDFVGYASFRGENRTLNFNPSEFHIGKNSANIPMLVVANFKDKPDYFAEIIDKMKQSINEMSESQKRIIETLKSYADDVANCVNVANLNAVLEMLKTEPTAIKTQVWGGLELKAREINCIFDKKEKLFIPKEITE